MTLPTQEADREAMLRGYLLGALPVPLQEEIDERFVTNGELHEELLATADDLIHAYLAGELPPMDRERFESHFLVSPRRRERVAFIRSLVTAVDRTREMPAPSRHVSAAGRWRWLPWAAIIAIGVGGWSAVEQRRSAGALTRAAQRMAEMQREVDEQRARIADLERAALSAVAADISTWTLGTGVERGPGGTEAFAVHGSWIRIRVPLDHDLQVASHRAVLSTREGREVMRVGGLREQAGAKGRTLDLMVPAALLRPGSYLLVIERDAPGAPEELTATSFSVR